MKQKFFKKSYTLRITLAILLFSLLPCILLGGIYLKNTVSDWKKNILKNYQNDTETTALLISKTTTEFQAKMQYLITNYDLKSYLSRIDELSIPQGIDLIAATNKTVDSITVGNNDMKVRWYPHKSTLSYGNYCYTLERFTEEFPEGALDPGYLEILALKEGESLWKVRNIAREGNNKGIPKEMLCLYSQITDLYGPSCILEFSIPVESLSNPARSFTPVSESLFAVCFNQSDTPLDIVLSSTLDTAVCEELLNQYHNSHKVPGYEIVRSDILNIENSEVIFLIPQAYVYTLVFPQIIGYIILAAVITFGMLSACYVTSHFLTRKIENALNTLTTDLNHTLAVPIPYDFKQDGDEINRIVLQVQQLIQDTQKYELELLQMSFNPHLLYNTLDAINHQVRNPYARSAIDSLCSYYRIVLNNGHMLIRMEDEIDMIKKYLSIVVFTYGFNDITFNFEIQEQIKQCTIIKHLLQPIVENALNHGIRPAGHGGILRVLAYEAENDIYIQIKDNGVGMTPEKASQLLQKPSASIYGGGYGIYNVQQRIQVYYGAEYGLHIESSPEGTTVTVHIPKMLPNE